MKVQFFLVALFLLCTWQITVGSITVGGPITGSSFLVPQEGSLAGTKDGVAIHATPVLITINMWNIVVGNVGVTCWGSNRYFGSSRGGGGFGGGGCSSRCIGGWCGGWWLCGWLCWWLCCLNGSCCLSVHEAV